VRALREIARTKFARDAFVLQFATLVQGATYFITSVLTKRYLGLDDMGRWVAAREMFTLAYFFVSMGVVNATLSRYSEAIGRQDRQGAVNALAAMVKIGSLSAAAVLVLGFTLAPWAGERFYEDRQIGVYAQWLCIAGLFEVVRGLTVAALQGTRQMRPFAAFDITTTLLRLGIVWAALEAGWGIPGVVGAFLIHMLFAGAMALAWYRRARHGESKLAPPPLRSVLAAVPRAPLGHIFGIGYLLALNKSMNTLVPRFGMLLIPALGVAAASQQAFSDNAAYSIGYVLSWGLSLAMTGVAQTLLPSLGFRLGRDDVPFEQMGGYLRRVSLASGAFMITATLVSVPIMYVVIRFVYGADAADARAFEYYLWLVSGNLFIGFTVIVESFYIYSGKLRQVLPWNLLMATAGLAGIVLGGRWFGPMGVAAAAGLCRGLGLFHLVYIGVYFRRARASSTTHETPR
jgi:O-antigen/teichoic acid export membrane protein